MTFIVTSSFVLKNGLIIFDLGVSHPVNTFVLGISFTRVWSIFFFIIKIRHLSGQYSFLSSLCSTGFPHFKHIKVIFSPFRCYLNGFPGLPECLGISYSYIGCWFGCQMGYCLRGFQRISTFTIIVSIYTQLFLSELEIGSNSRGTLIGVLAKTVNKRMYWLKMILDIGRIILKFEWSVRLFPTGLRHREHKPLCASRKWV